MCLVGSIHHILRAVLHLKTLFRYKYWTSDYSFPKARGNRVQCFSYANCLSAFARITGNPCKCKDHLDCITCRGVSKRSHTFIIVIMQIRTFSLNLGTSNKEF